jgi:hypothetical protein
MDNQQILTPPVARQIFLESCHLSQGDPILQGYLLRYVAICRPAWRLSEQSCQRLCIQLLPTVRALTARGMHCPLSRWKARRELTSMAEVMRVTFDRARADHSDLVISLLRGFIFRDWRFLCDLGGRPRSGDPFLPHHDPYLSFFCHYLLLGHQTGVDVFDELLADLRDAITSQSALYEAAMDYPSATLCLAEVIAMHNAKHPDRLVPDLSIDGGNAPLEEKEVVYG